MRKILLICIAIILGGCAVDLRPSWNVTGDRYLERFKSNYLTQGPGELAERPFEKAVEEIKKSGNLDLLEKAWLTRMAVQTASLMEADGGDYREIAEAESVPENENFYKFLKGDISAVDIKLLPEQYRDFGSALLTGDVIKTGKTIASIKDQPVSRLIAAGIAVRCNLEDEAIIQAAVDVASVNGWKAALITWLNRLAAFHDAADETAKAAQVRRRIELIR